MQKVEAVTTWYGRKRLRRGLGDAVGFAPRATQPEPPLEPLVGSVPDSEQRPGQDDRTWMVFPSAEALLRIWSASR